MDDLPELKKLNITMEIKYFDYRSGGEIFMTKLGDLIKANQVQNILEIGSSKYPSLSKAFIDQYDVNFSVMDIEPADLTELELENDYIDNYFVHDITKPFKTDLKFDLIISKFIWEHIEQIDLFHININQLLKDEGVAIHYFPCLSTLPFLINHVLPSNLSDKVLNTVNKREKEKYPAYYKWCYGPSTRNIRKIKAIGYDITSYYCFFGHNYYKKNLIILHYFELLKLKLLVRFRIKSLCSYAMVVLKKSG
ncbi:MAG: hypothetical protein AB8B74_14955 [Crocinitomicaceae bacterium]